MLPKQAAKVAFLSSTAKGFLVFFGSSSAYFLHQPWFSAVCTPLPAPFPAPLPAGGAFIYRRAGFSSAIELLKIELQVLHLASTS